jgi:hypothetical protein
MNPFVNPNQRGFELPASCKDLNDVLLKADMSQAKQAALTRELGNLTTLRRFVRRLYEGEVPRRVLTVSYEKKRVCLILRNVGDVVTLTFQLGSEDRFVEEAITEIFGEGTLATPAVRKDELRTVQVPLPTPMPAHLQYWQEAAQCVIDLLIRGFGVPEAALFLLTYQEFGASEA